MSKKRKVNDDIENTIKDADKQTVFSVVLVKLKERTSLDELLHFRYDGVKKEEKVLAVDIPGTICVARAEDGSWRQATIIEKLSDTRFTVSFIDYPETGLRDCEVIKTIDPDLIDIPKQSIRCSFESTIPRTEEEFKQDIRDLGNNKMVPESLDRARPEYVIRVIRNEASGSKSQVEENVNKADQATSSQEGATAASHDIIAASASQQAVLAPDIGLVPRHDRGIFSELNITELFEILRLKLPSKTNMAATQEDILIDAILHFEDL